MKALQEEGMYLLLDLGQGKWSINREFPSYNMDLLNRYKRTVDAFAKSIETPIVLFPY